MKKRELIEYCESLKGDLNKFINVINVDKIIAKIEQLDEPQKPVVQQFVADWYEENKDNFDYKVWECVFHDGKGEKTEMSEWINRTENAFITLVNMHQFGFEVEKEKRYLVKIRATKHYFAKDGNRKIYFSLAYKSCFTKKELEEAGFGWVFSCEGVEIKEVEE